MPMISAEQANDLLARLSNIPMTIAYIVMDWLDSDFERTVDYDPNGVSWSGAEILAHLRASEDILSHRVIAMLTRDHPLLPAYDERRWADIVGYRKIDFRASLTLFTLLRAELVATLHAIPLHDWMRSGTHDELGTLTVYDVVRKLVEHEEEHCAQLEKLGRRIQLQL